LRKNDEEEEPNEVLPGRGPKGRCQPDALEGKGTSQTKVRWKKKDAISAEFLEGTVIMLLIKEGRTADLKKTPARTKKPLLVIKVKTVPT